MLNLPLASLNEFLLVHATERSLLLVGLLVSINLGHVILTTDSLLCRFINVGPLVPFSTQELELRRQLSSHIALLFLSLLVYFRVRQLICAVHHVRESHVKTFLLVQESASLRANWASGSHSIL